ncbi:hypothetical protein Leryth_022705 [Lithospermum erythrorhizon]|nr:hypothetical protein Leryth_022705 [Lithospermum erythrorhizon]
MSTLNIGNCSNNGGDGSNNSGRGGGGGGGGPCGACKFLRRKCEPRCVFAPYFDPEQGAAHFAAVHKVFGASNISKLLGQIPVQKRLDTLRQGINLWLCCSRVFRGLTVMSLQTEIAYLNAHLGALNQPTPPPFPQPAMLIAPPQLSISDLPSASSIPATYDLSVMHDPVINHQHSWTMPPQMARTQLDSRQFLATNNNTTRSATVERSSSTYSAHHDLMYGDLHDMARVFLERDTGGASSSDGGCNEDDNNT